MPRYLITFGVGAMDHVPQEELPDVGRAAHAVCQEMIDAGVFVLAGGLADAPATTVSDDGTTLDVAVGRRGQPGSIAGLTVIDVPTESAARAWAARVAAACRCAQEVREIRHDPELEDMLRRAAG